MAGQTWSAKPSNNCASCWRLAFSSLAWHRGNREPLGPSQHLESDTAADLIAGERAHEIVRAGNGAAVKRDNNVAGPQPGPLGGRIRLDGTDHHRAVLDQSGRTTAQRRDRGLLRGNPDEGAAHAAVPHQLTQYEACGIGGDGEADALRAHDDGGVDANHLAAGRHQWPAGIARIERSVDLDDIVDQPAVA